MNDVFWVSLLSIPEAELKKWHEQNARSESLLYWAIKKNLLDERVYLNLARNYYGLPELHENYFEKEPNLQVFTQHQNLFSWSAECLPIVEWQNCIYVAALEPVSVPEPNGKKVITLLTSLSGLEKWWRSLTGSEEVTAEIPMALIEQAKLDPPAPMDSPLSLETPVMQKTEGLPPAPPKDEPLLVLDTSEENEPKPAESNIPGDEEENLLNLSFDPIPLTSPLRARDVAPPPPPIAEKVVPPQLPKTEAKIPTPPAPPADANLTTAPLQSLKVADAAGTPPPPPPPKKPTTRPPSLQSTNPIDLTMNEMGQMFEKIMILSVAGLKTTPFKWSEHFGKKESAEPRTFDMSKKGFFRIVKTTHKPFHGYVVTNEANEQFIKEWLNGAVPKHMTIVPVMNDEELQGLLMGVELKEGANAREALLKAIQCASGLLNQIKVQKPTAA
ncbi:MAG: hypothetical protein AB7O96_03975 [Pseudobdellovibrionaceae bacterium]